MTRQVLKAQQPAVGTSASEEQHPAVLYGSELLVGGLMVAMALLAWAGLALADLGRYRPLSAFAVAVACCAAILALA